jgi:hypothetical protein
MIPQRFDWLPIGEVLLHYQGHVVDSQVRVPDIFRVDDDIRPVSTLIEAPAVVHADPALEAGPGDLLFEGPVDFY